MLDSVLNTIGTFYPTGNKINAIITTFLSIIVIHKAFYFLIGMFFTRKFKKAKKQHKYAIMIAARNEKYVIGNLLDSIKKQDYPSDLYTVFVVADNCTDNTAKIVREKGAICYERFDDEHRTKGFALEFLVENIKKDYGIDTYEGYFIFDADNLLKSNYISKMNDAFDFGSKITTSYRNTKNFDENWVASTYALHWIRSIRINHRARSVLRLATNIQGTGFLFSNEIIKNGWHYTSLTEDRALTADAVAQGYQISYQDEAEFFDEQPLSLKVALRQRLRWSKGHLQAFCESGPYLFINIFFGKRFLKTNWRNYKHTKKKNRTTKEFFKDILESIRHRFASFDTLVQLTPLSVINLIKWVIVYVIFYTCYCYSNGLDSNILLETNNITNQISYLFLKDIIIDPGFKALIMSLFFVIICRIIFRLTTFLGNILLACYVFIIERKRIKKIKLKNKLLYIFTFPIFDMIGRYTTYIALFKKVTWKEIPHKSKITIDDIH